MLSVEVTSVCILSRRQRGRGREREGREQRPRYQAWSAAGWHTARPAGNRPDSDSERAADGRSVRAGSGATRSPHAHMTFSVFHVASSIVLVFMAAILKRTNETFDQMSDVVEDEAGRLASHLNNLTIYSATSLQINIVEGLRVLVYVLAAASIVMTLATTEEALGLIRGLAQWLYRKMFPKPVGLDEPQQSLQLVLESSQGVDSVTPAKKVAFKEWPVEFQSKNIEWATEDFCRRFIANFKDAEILATTKGWIMPGKMVKGDLVWPVKSQTGNVRYEVRVDTRA